MTSVPAQGEEAARGAFLVGPTASGKTDVAHVLARTLGLPVLSADAMMVYRHMDLGTAKPSEEERRSFRYFGLDLVDPDLPFSAGAYLACAREALVAEAGPWLVVGGTGLYIRCLLQGLDPAAPSDLSWRAEAEALLAAGGLPALQEKVRARFPEAYARLADPANPRRLMRAWECAAAGDAMPVRRPPPGPVAGLRPTPDLLATRIEARVRAMYGRGLLEEAAALRDRFPHLSDTARQAIGYREAFAVLQGDLAQEEAIAATVRRTRQYAKRQMTWFRHQLRVEWIDIGPATSVEACAERVAAVWNRHGYLALHQR